MITLALDQAAGITGLAVGDGKSIIEHGIIKGKGKSYPDKIHSVKCAMESLFVKHDIDKVLLEGVADYSRNIGTFGKLSALQGVLIESCICHGKEYKIVAPSTWRSKLGIKGKKRDDIKASAMLYVSENFQEGISEDACEAICILWSEQV